ncbi:MAG: 4-hydroxythreonine-4-phosphate dehydrogenase PdxA [Synechococcales cyanobacterium CRU_2_2]|nr:4-hydroxythreonine-4-phosphate dehydrogenase PdxA [Synechococcales cyanobacterium CRU_2_2]
MPEAPCGDRLGDPAGIGPEVTLKALAHPEARLESRITLVGSINTLKETYQRLRVQGQTVADPSAFDWIDVPTEGAITLGQGSAASGAASFAALNRAIDLALESDPGRRAQAVVTAPIAKSAWKAAGHFYPGQTERLAERAGVADFGMIFGRSPHTRWVLRTLLATTHIPLAQVALTLTPALMSQKLGLLLRFLQKDCGLARPRVAIAGLNPHSGEQGQIGTEEQDWMLDWLQQARLQFSQAQLDGPIPPDTLWVAPGQAWFGSPGAATSGAAAPGAAAHRAADGHDAYLALYHDQGLIPVKLMAFDCAVNATLGLPFIRTSPDHGTAFEIAGKGTANASSMAAAIAWANALNKP